MKASERVTKSSHHRAAIIEDKQKYTVRRKGAESMFLDQRSVFAGCARGSIIENRLFARE